MKLLTNIILTSELATLVNKFSFYNQQPAKKVPFWVAFTVLYLSLKKA